MPKKNIFPKISFLQELDDLKNLIKFHLMCGSNIVSYIPPPRGISPFLQLAWWKDPVGRGEIPRIIKVTGEIPSIPEGGMYDTKFEPHIKIF